MNLSIKERYEIRFQRFLDAFSGPNLSVENECNVLRVIQEHLKLNSGKELEEFIFPMIETISKMMDEK